MPPRAKLSSKSQVVIPKKVRDKLGLKPGDGVIFRETEGGVRLERAESDEDPFATFHEWASAADDEAYSEL